jgi:hypothetical protein
MPIATVDPGFYPDVNKITCGSEVQKHGFARSLKKTAQ